MSNATEWRVLAPPLLSAPDEDDATAAQFANEAAAARGASRATVLKVSSRRRAAGCCFDSSPALHRASNSATGERHDHRESSASRSAAARALVSRPADW